MKTPKRHSDTPDLIDKRDCARWKRKNRIKQLKRSLRRYKTGDFLFYREKQAYLLLQKLQKPSKKANLATWDNYTLELLEIAKHINIALVDANFKAGICYAKTKQHKKMKTDIGKEQE